MPKRKTQAEWVASAVAKHGDRYDYSQSVYTTSQRKVVIICPDHGEFMQKPNNHLNGNNCPDCNDKTQLLLLTTAEWIALAVAKHSDRYDYSRVVYVNSNEKVIIICSHHGEFTQKPSAHVFGNNCPLCTGTRLYTTDEWIVKAKEQHGDRYDYSRVVYIGRQKKVTIICKEHGEFVQRAANHAKGENCPKCANAYQSENMCRDIIENLMGAEFPNLRPNFMNGLELDCYNKQYKLVLECHGRQHYVRVPHWQTEDQFANQQLRDIKKKKILKSLGIHLIVVDRRKYNHTNPYELEQFIIDEVMIWCELNNLYNWCDLQNYSKK